PILPNRRRRKKVGRAVPKPAQPEPKTKAIVLFLLLVLFLDLSAPLVRLRGQFAALAQKICAKMTDFRLYVSSAPRTFQKWQNLTMFANPIGALGTARPTRRHLG